MADDADLGPHLPPGSSEFVPETADRPTWERVHAFRRVLDQDLRPDDRVAPDAVAEAGYRRPDPFEEHRRFIRVEAGSVVSMLWLAAPRPGTPEYESNRHQVEADIKVLPARRRAGLATAWLPAVAAYAAARGARVVTFETGHEAGHAAASSLGAEARLRSWESRLWLERADWNRMLEWSRIDPGPVRLEPYEPFPEESRWEEYARQYTELERHVPREQLEIGEWILTPERMRAHRERMRASGQRLHILAAWDGEGMVAITELMSSEHEPEALDQELTAVHPRARGRGLAKLLKARLLLDLHERLPEARFVRTYNAGSNEAMWGINRAMGFERYREYISYQVPVETLRSRLPPHP